MTPPSMETVFLILSGVILFAGVVYWLWSHIQLTQKKVQLLENAVFELRAMIPGGGTAGPPASSYVAAAAAAAPAPSPVVAASAKQYTDLADDDWEDGGDSNTMGNIPTVSTPLEEVLSEATATPVPTPAIPQMFIQEKTDDLMPGGRLSGSPASEDLAPGGRIAVIPEPEEREVPLTEDAFKAMLTGRAAAASAASAASATVVGSSADSVVSASTPALEGMPLKELRRLGEQRGIVGAAEMRKKELLAALRQQVAAPAPATATLDLDAVEAGEILEPPVASDIEQEAQILE